ncbi:MAG: hypothetical protein ABIW57_13645 [Polyangia bacterium]
MAVIAAAAGQALVVPAPAEQAPVGQAQAAAGQALVEPRVVGRAAAVRAVRCLARGAPAPPAQVEPVARVALLLRGEQRVGQRLVPVEAAAEVPFTVARRAESSARQVPPTAHPPGELSRSSARRPRGP